MAMSYKARKRWALVILVVGLPVYIILASVLATWLNTENFLVTLALYVGLGIVWILPFKSVFLGIGQADPDAPPEDDQY
ncbi:uncharacterized protein DUF2842 [Shimia isoporae]|uniref:Uncharacterized protein DUF2842 n=1 Tax=Shimia isoporae TaxID=647720 RepID=A0A4R1NUT8_9RHOB|nr:DUF2842 domain-containing protein [Shimia isoporae]TCL09018.1 uncharacterized protein DUF2842 [Shimia isoporae]